MGEQRLEEAPRFGTSGLRGVEVALTDALVARYAAVFVSLFPHDGTLLIGRDLRASSPRIARAVAVGAVAKGVRAIDCGVLPTPALALAAMDRGTLAIMVTGSHIPADRNGLKFYKADGEISKSDEVHLVAAVAAENPVATTEFRLEPGDVLAAFVSRYTEFWDANTLRGMRIGVWEHSSAAREVLSGILETLGAELVALGRSDDFIPVDTEAIGPDLRRQLAAWVKEHALDALVSTDGDGDRPLIVDGAGCVVAGDVIGPVAARALGANRIVSTVSANTLVERMGSFDIVERCRIGSPFVIEAMAPIAQEIGAKTIGYEPNGGFILGFEARRGSKVMAPLMTRDAVLPIVAVLAAARESSLTALLSDLPSRHTATDRLAEVPSERSHELMQSLIANHQPFMPEGIGKLQFVDTTDGVRLTFAGDVIVMVRPSGNAPELRCYVEAESEAEARVVLEAVLDKLGRALELPT